MQNERRSAIKRGMQLAADLPDIMPQQADARIKPIYEEIQKTLRVPIVNLIFRSLANYPDFLEPAWNEVGPIARLPSFEDAADKLRMNALLEMTPGTLPVDGLADADRLRSFNDTIHYVLPKLLLIATAFHEASFGQTGEVTPHPGEQGSSIIPLGIAEGTAKVEMVDPGNASDQIHTLFESIKQRHGHPLVSSYYRGLANWPDVLHAAWNDVAPRVGSSEYEARKNALVEQAQSHVRAWPLQSIDVPETDRAEIGDILSAFRLKFIPEMLLDAGMIKRLLDGSEAARNSRFSVATRF